MTDQEMLMWEEIREMPGQEIANQEEGKSYLECTLLTVPGVYWTIEAMSTTLLQVTQFKGIPCQAINALRSIAFVLEQVEDNARCARIATQVKESLAADRVGMVTQLEEAAALVSKASTIAETAAALSLQVTKEAAATILQIQNASTNMTMTVTQLSETTTTYRDALKRATTETQQATPGATTVHSLDARIRAREGIKLTSANRRCNPLATAPSGAEQCKSRWNS
jgi:hypothetical protein